MAAEEAILEKSTRGREIRERRGGFDDHGAFAEDLGASFLGEISAAFEDYAEAYHRMLSLLRRRAAEEWWKDGGNK